MPISASPLPACEKWRLVLAISLAGNGLTLGVAVYTVHGRGGLSYLKARLRHDPEANVDATFVHRQSLFEGLTARRNRPIVFLGDSITAGCEWRELFGDDALVLNRGISGDTSAGVLKRIDSVAALKPLAVFLMIGTNDAQALGYRPADTLANHRRIVRRLLESSPGTWIYEQSILPSQVPRFNRWSAETNEGIRRLADGKSVFYLNLRDAFSKDGKLDSRFTNDGLHLNGGGYLLWRQYIGSIMEDLIKAQSKANP